MGRVGNELLSSAIRVYLIAENRLLRQTLVRLFRKRGDIAIVGEGHYSESKAEEIVASCCDVLLLDSIPEANDTNLLCELLENSPEMRIVLFGMNGNPEIFLGAVRSGVSGYVLKDASASELISAIRVVAQGEAVCPPKLCMTLFQSLSRAHREKPTNINSRPRSRFGLTYRQLQLVSLVARGLTNKEIAVNLNLSEYTVKNHLRRIMKQVDADDRHHAVDVIRAGGLLVEA